MPHVLLIDDDREILELEAELVKATGHSVTTALNGREGLGLFERQAFDLVITDLVMPEMEGIETIRRMKHLRPESKIVAVSGASILHTESYLMMARSLGALQTVAKPFSSATFIAAMTAALRGEATGTADACGA